MTKLIRADFARMFKTLSFWLCGAFSTAFILWFFFLEYCSKHSAAGKLGTLAFSSISSFILMFFASIFAALFVGTDYLNGTIRNKISIGHSRASIYFSNLIICSIGGMLHCVMCWAALFIVGLFTKGRLGLEPGELALRLAVTLFAMISVCAFSMIIGMLTTAKSSAVVINIVGSIVMVIGINVLNGLLYDPEPAPQNKILQVVCDAVPYGQALKIDGVSNEEKDNRSVMPLYSVGFTAAVSAVGTVVFSRKDIK